MQPGRETRGTVSELGQRAFVVLQHLSKEAMAGRDDESVTLWEPHLEQQRAHVRVLVDDQAAAHHVPCHVSQKGDRPRRFSEWP